ncbi:hypothetical protein [Haloarchaeobius sp. HRN-SO-5]|uniref:hypothetical protein n=1 Tax=Haloarchaeobius sp. HRN-SO-5 TaxID=3446118 RepID=UPI003EBB09C5
MTFGTSPGGVRGERAEWVLRRADELDVQPAVVWGYLERNVEDGIATVDEHRTRLARLFKAHLARPMLSDNSRIRIYDGSEGRFDYIKGTHYVQQVSDEVRRLVHVVADEQRMTVEVDGTSGVAVRFTDPVPSADAHVASELCRRALGTPLDGLDDVVEIVDCDTQRSWTEVG